MIKKLDWSRNNIIAYEIDDKVEADEYKELIREIEDLLDEFGRIKLYTRITNFKGSEMATFDDRLKFLKDNDLDKVVKFAVVGDAKTVKVLAKGMDKINETKIKQFDLGQEEEARDWLFDGTSDLPPQ